jgi:hypothetical protein
MPELVALTATVAEVECVSDPEVPVTVSVKVEGVTECPRVTVNVEDAEPPLGGVTELGEANANTPLGCPDTLRATGELNPLSELTATVVEADPPTLTVMGETGLSEKSGLTAAIFVTKASAKPCRALLGAGRGFTVGKLVEPVVPVTYALPEESTAMALPFSKPLPPR